MLLAEHRERTWTQEKSKRLRIHYHHLKDLVLIPITVTGEKRYLAVGFFCLVGGFCGVVFVCLLAFLSVFNIIFLAFSTAFSTALRDQNLAICSA